MAKENIWKLLESVAQSQAVNAQLKEEHDREMRELRDIVKETAQQIKQVNKQLGELGNTWGSLAEGMARPSLEKILRQDFGMDVVENVKSDINGRSLEIDLLAYAKEGRNEAYIVETKSRLTGAAIAQIIRTLSEAPEFFPHLNGRKLYGILVAVEIPASARKEAIKSGLYVGQMSDETFKLSVPEGFKPRNFGHNGHANGRKKKSSKD
jgi:hypothetical protein